MPPQIARLQRAAKHPMLGRMTPFSLLPDRAVIALTGIDRVSFLNGLVSNDVAKAAPGRAVWAALLTPQGKYLHDFFVFATEGALLLDVRADEAEILRVRLSRYKLRAKVEITLSPLRVYATWGGDAPTGIVAPDPRHAEAGWRLLAAGLATTTAEQNYAAHRLALGLPDGPPDLEPDKTLLLEARFDELNGVDFGKGCYMGQEITARSKYRGTVKKRLVAVRFAQAAPPPGTPVLAGDEVVGDVRSGQGALALAMLRIDALEKALTAEGAALAVSFPADPGQGPAF